MLRRVGAGLAAVVLAGGVLAGCSGDDSGSDPDAGDGSSSASTAGETGTAGTAGPSASASSLPVPAGVELSPQGSQLAVGDTATVAYQPKQDEVGVLDITITRLEKTTIKKSFEGWDLDAGQKKASPYFVRATITNRGDTDLGGRRVPLYVVDGDNTLIEATSFASAFTACQPGAFPKKFPTGKKTKVCLVYLVPRQGDLTAVSFRPTQEFDPITWSGELQDPEPPKPAGGKGGKNKSGQRGG
ncbi:hypothetical protein G5V58_08170 [Nocardioides anomalus]|uniref:DUF4352 domain-containing protein n=1 Tax=Nocardioides anomalus TaxID=2712223 RepID=A0A6G6WBN8_9ACTN|nr:hypothetical protein [Nocardioides anomalus]QIG42761.1 hypothetical protein G5V58_08170 [Nocardioides anomalus]